MACFLVFDAGTSGGKAAIYDTTGRSLAEATRPWGYETPAELAPWGREFDTEQVWKLLCDAGRACLTAVDARDVAALAATAQRQGTVILDAAGSELLAAPNVDLRATFEGMRLLNERGKRIHAITGHLPPMLFASARWLWLRTHRPQLCDRAAHLLLMADWLTWRLTGRAVAAASSAAETGLFDVTAGDWSAELLADLAVPRAILPEVSAAGTLAGPLTPAAADALGLRPGIPVAVAPPDTPAALLGLGVTAPGQSGIVVGWSAPAQLISASPIFDPQAALWTTCSALDGRWALEGNAGPAGAAQRWAVELLLPGDDIRAFDALAATAPAGSGGAVALLGPRIADYGNPQLLWGGLLFPQANDLLPIGRAELARAALENIAFAVKANLEQMEACARSARCGFDERPRLGGGLARSRLFPQILADVLGRPVRTAAVPASGLGAAMAAAVAAGVYGTLPEAIAAMAAPTAEFTPRPLAQAEYADAYERWLQVYHSLASLSGQLG